MGKKDGINAMKREPEDINRLVSWLYQSQIWFLVYIFVPIFLESTPDLIYLWDTVHKSADKTLYKK